MISYKKFLSFLLPWVFFAFFMSLLRLSLAEIHSYLYMNWNLFLAFVPLLFLFLFEKSNLKILKIFFFLFWLFFLPNAVYMITDFIHLRNVGPEWLLWFDGMMIFSYALIGLVLSSFTIIKMKKNIFPQNKKKQMAFLAGISFLVSFGVYLGRYMRWNTWDVVAQPFSLTGNIFYIIREHYFQRNFIFFIILFSLFTFLSSKTFAYFFENKQKE